MTSTTRLLCGCLILVGLVSSPVRLEAQQKKKAADKKGTAKAQRPEVADASPPPANTEQKYELGPLSQPNPKAPRGNIMSFEVKSQIFPGTVRDCRVYIPFQLSPQAPAKLMVFQDGHAYAARDGQFRVPVVMDNLIHDQKLPPIVCVFVNPGHAGSKPDQPWSANNRSVEYDTLSDAYVRHILEEVLPEVEKLQPLSKKPEDRAICGISSGGICAWTAAWERPDQFGKVMSHVGSFTNIRGGHDCQARVRKTDKKPLRVYLQANEFDVDNEFGNWFLANQEMAAALKYKGYDYKLVNGKGGHNAEFGGSILPEGLLWLWREGND